MPVAAKTVTPPTVEIIDDIAPVLVLVPEISGPTDAYIAPPQEASCDPVEAPPVPEISKVSAVAPIMSGLGLDLVLNEISLQARLTTTATGAVIALARSGMLEGRAMTGSTAPAVATCLNMRGGIASTCFHTGVVGRADDLTSNIQADAQAYLRSGVRSTLVVQIANEKGDGLGIVQIFSPRANAFCDRDVLTLQALARRVVSNVEMVQKTDPLVPAEMKAAIALLSERPLAMSPAPPQPAPEVEPPKRRKRSRSTKHFSGVLLPSIRKTAWTLGVLATVAGFCQLSRMVWSRSDQVGSGASSTAVRVSAPVPTIPDNQIKTAIDIYTKSEPTPYIASRSQKNISQALFSSIAIERKPLSKPLSTVAADQKPTVNSTMPAVELHGVTPQTTQGQAPALKAQVAHNSASTDQQEFDLVSTQTALKLLVQRVEPEYPNAARQQHIQGTVMLDAKVNAEGTVDGVTLVSGESQLMNAAAAAVQQWKFQPLVKDGKPRKFESRIAIEFKLVSGGSPQGQ